MYKKNKGVSMKRTKFAYIKTPRNLSLIYDPKTGDFQLSDADTNELLKEGNLFTKHT